MLGAQSPFEVENFGGFDLLNENGTTGKGQANRTGAIVEGLFALICSILRHVHRCIAARDDHFLPERQGNSKTIPS